MLLSPPLRTALLIALCTTACTLERGGAGLANTIDVDGGLAGAGGQGGGSGGEGGIFTIGGNGGDAGHHTTGGGGGAAGSGAGGSGAAGGAGAGGAGAGAAGGAGGAGAEDCLDGKDNDGDGAIDCADPDCANYECVDGAPTGWSGYFRLRDHDSYDPGAAKLDCAGGVPPTRFFAEPSPAECTPCACGGLTGGSCGPVPLYCADNKDCSGASDVSGELADGDCHRVGGGDKGSCYLGTAAVAQPGQCPATGGALKDPQPFKKMVDICGFSLAAGAGCSSKVCVPRPAPDYAGYVCISQQGEQACPSGWNIQRVVSANGTEQRSCSACTCAPNTTCTGGSYRVYDLSGCGGDNTDLTSASCKDFSGYKDFGSWGLKLRSGATAGGSCSPSGGVGTGQIALTGTQTFCCRP